MLRRRAAAILLAAGSRVAWAKSNNLEGYFDSPRTTAVMVDIASRRLAAAGGLLAARRSIQPPGSTLKPIVLSALMESGRLKADETFHCPGQLRIRDHSFDCIHPPLAMPLSIDLALAYSCNCFVAHMAERFERGELAREFQRFGFGSRTGLFDADEAAGRIRPAVNPDSQRIQALGEDGVEVTVAELAMAYRLLALKTSLPAMASIRKGLEEAVEFGTAQNARVTGAIVAGKTGSVVTPLGEPFAWFAGFFPSAAPKVALAVMLPGRSGGADAAPIAARIFAAYKSGAL